MIIDGNLHKSVTYYDGWQPAIEPMAVVLNWMGNIRPPVLADEGYRTSVLMSLDLNLIIS